MLVHTKEEFWHSLQNRNQLEEDLEIEDPKLIRSIMRRHYMYKILSTGLFIIALFIPVFLIGTHLNSEVVTVSTFNEKELSLAQWTQTLALLKPFVPCLVLVVLISISSRLLAARAIGVDFNFIYKSDKLIVSPASLKYYSPRLGLKFKDK